MHPTGKVYRLFKLVKALEVYQKASQL